jgi:hypothetical protein
VKDSAVPGKQQRENELELWQQSVEFLDTTSCFFAVAPVLSFPGALGRVVRSLGSPLSRP